MARGASKPLFRELITAASVHQAPHGRTGASRSCPARSDLSAFQLMEKILEESREPVTIIPTGALTNLGMLILARPDLKPKIARISLMGGAAVGGNWTPSAEFNILVDPEAAQVVFSSGLPVIMSGLDVTHRAIVTSEDIETFRNIGTRTAVMVAELMDFFKRFHEAHFASFGGRSSARSLCRGRAGGPGNLHIPESPGGRGMPRKSDNRFHGGEFRPGREPWRR